MNKSSLLPLFVVLLLSPITGFSQSGTGFHYQAVARDQSGAILSNTPVNLRFQIVEGTSSGPILYQETHSDVTNTFGLFKAVIGKGNAETGDFSQIEWEREWFYLITELNGAPVDTTLLESVPYAKVATEMPLSALSDVTISSIPLSDQILKWNGSEWTVSEDNAGPSYTAGNNILISGDTIYNLAPDQLVTLAGGGATTVSGSYPSFTINSTDLVDDADADPGNELQSLSLSGTTLSLSNGGGSIGLSAFLSPWTTSGSNIYRTSGNIGIGTTSPVTALQLYANRDALFGSGMAGNGAKLIWDYSNRAFRAGYAAASSWNEDSIGLYSAAHGFGTIALGYNSYAHGFYTHARTYAGFSIGRYNVGSSGTESSWTSTDPLFEVGNGISNTNRNNAFTIRKDGRVAINDATPDYLLDIENPGISQRSLYINHDITSSSSTMYGIYVDADNSTANSGTSYGAYLSLTNNNDDAYGLYSLAFCDATDASPAYGIRAYVDNDNGTGWTYAVYGSVSGTTSGTKYGGYFNGDVYTNGSYLPSDRKLKTEIREAGSALPRIMNLPVATYQYRTADFPHMNLPAGQRVGFLAEDVKLLFPELVKHSIQPKPEEEELEGRQSGETDLAFDAVDYASLVPYLVKSIQEQQQLIEDLETEVTELRKEMESMQQE